MKTALLIARPEDKITSVTDFLKGEGFLQITCSISWEEAKSLAQKNEFDLILINCAPVPLEEQASAAYFSETTKSFVVIIAPNEYADELAEKTAENGVLVISRPVNRHLFHHYLQFVSVFKRRMLGVWQENSNLKHMVEEIKVIDRAKYLLMQCLSMTENQAHQYLQRQAMDMRMTKFEVAMYVIRTYST